MIKYPLNIKITFKNFPDLNYRIFNEGNEISYKIVENELVQPSRYVITSTMTEEKALYEILYEILLELGLSPADLVRIVTPIHSEIAIYGATDFTFNEVKEKAYSWTHTSR